MAEQTEGARIVDSTEGPAYTTGNNFRARAEAQQRRYRSAVLGAPWEKHGHWFAEAAAKAGKNFVLPICAKEARARKDGGKGVAPRTFQNMLASQAMAFNLFAPLKQDWGKKAAAKALSAFVPVIATVESITFEYTPAPDLFGDQGPFSGVDCDLLIEFRDVEGAGGVLVIETKFVETEFSTCGIRRRKPGKNSPTPCPEDIRVAPDGSNCGYSAKGYLYWQRALERETLNLDAVFAAGCPFGGPLWQLWVNHTLAHEEAHRRGAKRAVFAVCAPRANTALLGEDGQRLGAFRKVVADPETVAFISVEDLIGELGKHADFPEAEQWVESLGQRYVIE